MCERDAPALVAVYYAAKAWQLRVTKYWEDFERGGKSSGRTMSTNITNKLAGPAALVTSSRSIGAGIASPDDTDSKAPSIKIQPRSTRVYFDVGIGSVCLSGEDTGGKYCLLEVSLAPGMGVPRHTHTREDEVSIMFSLENWRSPSETNAHILKQGDTLDRSARHPPPAA